uniref:Uncharacterized protein n=1 Tax=Oryza glumipatula TaxID=40148 RepID=A0A0D9ZIQ8_9ORYZ
MEKGERAAERAYWIKAGASAYRIRRGKNCEGRGGAGEECSPVRRSRGADGGSGWSRGGQSSFQFDLCGLMDSVGSGSLERMMEHGQDEQGDVSAERSLKDVQNEKTVVSVEGSMKEILYSKNDCSVEREMEEVAIEEDDTLRRALLDAGLFRGAVSISQIDAGDDFQIEAGFGREDDEEPEEEGVQSQPAVPQVGMEFFSEKEAKDY